MLKRFTAVLLAFVLCLAFANTVFAVPAMRSIRLNDNGVVHNCTTTAITVGDLLKERGITLHKKDTISHELDRKLVDGWRIEIRRAFPIVITVDGEEKDFMAVPGARVANIVSDLTEEYGHGFYYSHSNSEAVNENSSLYFYSVIHDTATERENIEYETEIILTDELLIGESEVRRFGALGIKELSYDVSIRFGEDPVFTLANEEIIRDPVSRVVAYGIRLPDPEDIPEIDPNAPKEYIEKLTLNSSAYSLDFNSTQKLPSHPAYGITKSGIYAVPGVVAVDPTIIPLGTILYVDGYGYAVAADIGSAIKGMKIDLFFEDVDDALRYGRKNIYVYIVEYPDEEEQLM